MFIFVSIKSISLSNQARHDTNMGEMTTLLITNTDAFEHVIENLVEIFSAPFQIAMNAYFLYKEIGMATFIGKFQI